MRIDPPRIDFGAKALNDEDLGDDPILVLYNWWQEAVLAQVMMLDAVVLSTVDALGHPDARVVLLKDFDERGLVFYTNYQSDKALHIGSNPNVAINIFWPQLERQIRVRGRALKTSVLESREYFSKRPRGAQIGAWASQQSQTLSSRLVLEQAYQDLESQFANRDVPYPPHWGGFRLQPNYFEFWQGRPNRLHDRFSFTKTDSSWQRLRLFP